MGEIMIRRVKIMAAIAFVAALCFFVLTISNAEAEDGRITWSGEILETAKTNTQNARSALNNYYVPEEYTKTAEVQFTNGKYSDVDELENIYSTVTNIIKGKNTPLQKAEAIHDWIALNIDYPEDMEGYDGYPTHKFGNPFTVYKQKLGVCYGYANLTSLMMQKAGVPCVVVRGGSIAGSHVWNAIYVSDQWYFIDNTWDSNYTHSRGQLQYKWWLKDDAYMAGDHRISFIENCVGDVCYYPIPVYGNKLDECYEVSFDLRGGCGITKALILNDDNWRLYPTYNIPEKDGFTFEGWYNKDNNRIQTIKASTVSKGEILYAKWKNKLDDYRSVSFGNTKYQDKRILSPEENDGYGMQDRIARCYKYTGAKGEKIRITVDSQADTIIVLLDSNGDWISTTDFNGSNDREKYTYRFESAGDIYIQVANINNSDSGSFTITIERPLNSIVLSCNSMELNTDASKNLSVSFDPSNTTDLRQVTWSSSNEGVAKVSSNGEVSGVSEGSATITARCGEKTASCSVNVKSINKSAVRKTENSVKVSGKGDNGNIKKDLNDKLSKSQPAAVTGEQLELIKMDTSIPRVSKKAIKTRAKIGKGKMNIIIKKVHGAENYLVAYNIMKNAGAKAAGWKFYTTGKKTSYVIKGLKKGSLLQFKATAMRGGKRGNWSDVSYRWMTQVKGKITSGKRKIIVRVPKIKGASGYDVMYSADKKMKGQKTIRIPQTKKPKAVIRGMKKGKNCYIKYRPFTKSGGKKYDGVIKNGKIKVR